MPPRLPLARSPRIGGPISDNVQVSPADNNVYSTTAAAYDPTNHANLYAAANMLTATPVAGFASTDAGFSWSMQPFPLPGTPPNGFGFYPGAAFDALGNLYASSEAYNVSGGRFTAQLVVSKSLDKGKTWWSTSTVEPPSANPEKPLIAIDTTASPYRNRIYVAYDTNPVSHSEPVVVSSSDDGVTWGRTQIADTGGDFGGYPSIGPNGEVYVAWDSWCGVPPSICGPSGAIVMAKSTNGARSFTALGQSPTLVSPTNAQFEVVPSNYGNGCTNPPIGVNPAPSLDVDRSGGVHNGALYIAWGDVTYMGGPMHIFFSRSTDGGAHWSAAQQLDAGNRIDAWQPALSVDQSTGAVTVAWYDRRDDANGKLYRTYYTQSTDGGVTFLPNQVAVATTQSDPTLDCFGTGDYMQMSSADGLAHPFWSDTRNGRNQIFTAAVDEALLAETLSPPVFAPEISVPVGQTTSSVAAGDFNGDGKLDLAVANEPGNSISILLGKGDGTFRAPAFTISGLTGSLAVGDFNKDGKLDLAVAGFVDHGAYQTASVFVVLGKGDGTFAAPLSNGSTVGGRGARLAVADLNKDGNPDLVVSSQGAGSNVGVLLGKGDGTFQSPVHYQGGNLAAGVAVADFNGDGNLDLAVANANSGTVSVFLGKGDGTFSAPVNYDAGSYYGAATMPDAITVGDFNGDGRPDIAVATFLYNSFSILINKGDGTFLPAVRYGSCSYCGVAIASGDFNGDGKIDLAVTNHSSNVSVWLGKGDGTFTAAGTYAGGSETGDIIAADLNNDRHPDLVMADRSSNDVSILLAATRSAIPQPSALRFPEQVARTVGSIRVVSLSNSGTDALRVAIAEVAGPNAQHFQKVGDTCSGASILNGGSCTISLRFAPKVVGSWTADLRITDDATGSPQLVPLAGTALLRNPNVVPAAPPSSRGLPPPPPPRPRSQPVRLFRLLLL